MSIESIKKILELHDINYTTIEGKIIADGDNITSFSILQLSNWLGY